MDAERCVPVAVLPGFPTSAIFTFHEFIAPVIRRFGGLQNPTASSVRARLPGRVNSERGRTEYLLVGLVEDTKPASAQQDRPSLIAYPMGGGSGSVTTFGRADGFVVIPRQREYLEAGDIVDVHLLATGLRPADLVVIGSHCVGLDYLLGELRDQQISSKFLAVGSMGGLSAARQGQCDLAGIHLLDPVTGTYNQPYVSEDLILIEGYRRLQGIVFRRGDRRFEEHSVVDAVAQALADPDCVLVNRNRGSGTRALIDTLLGGAQPPGYWAESRSHNAVVAAVAQGRADWGIAIEPVAAQSGLGFLPLQEEHYDFVAPRTRLDRSAVKAFQTLLADQEVRRTLSAMGFTA